MRTIGQIKQSGKMKNHRLLQALQNNMRQFVHNMSLLMHETFAFAMEQLCLRWVISYLTVVCYSHVMELQFLIVWNNW